MLSKDLLAGKTGFTVWACMVLFTGEGICRIGGKTNVKEQVPGFLVTLRETLCQKQMMQNGGMKLTKINVSEGIIDNLS